MEWSHAVGLEGSPKEKVEANMSTPIVNCQMSVANCPMLDDKWGSKLKLKLKLKLRVQVQIDKGRSQSPGVIASGSHAFIAVAWISLRSHGIFDDLR